MKYALITGAAGGMGFATAEKLIEEGYRVLGLDLHQLPELPGLTAISTDLTDPDSIRQALDQVRQVTDHIDCIIHMAGIYDLNSLVEISEEDYQRIFQINVFAVYRINKAFLPLLAPGGRIIITTSELGPLKPLPFTGIYAITKGALEKYAWSLRMELQLLGHPVIVLRPGAVDTHLLTDSVSALDSFCSGTQLYPANAARFHQIVDRVESRNIAPSRIAALVWKILEARHPRFAYSINRNPLLLLMNLLPGRLQGWILRIILASR